MAKLKRLDFEAWQYRIPDKALLMESQKLVEIDNLLLEAAERLSGITEFTTYAYTSQYEKMDEAVRIYDALIHLQEGVNNELQEIDNDFFLRLANGTDRKHQGPMEALSSIHMEDISIPNQAGITRQWVYYNTSNQRCLGEAEKKEELTFQDFLCYSKDTEYETIYNPIFQEIFQEQYELSGLTQDYTYIEYMDGLLKAGEFNHEMYKPVQEFLSAGLDIITFGAKPLIEAFVGEDLITGEQMTETERYLRAIEGIVGLVSFGSIWSKLGKIGIEGVTAELAIEVMSDTSSTITSTSMNKLGANGIVSTVAGIIAGGITGSSINNAINTRVWSSHIETPEVPETPFQIQRETIQVEELPNRIDIDTRNNLSQLDGLETSYGKSSGKYDTTADFLTNIENRNGKFYTDKATIDKIGQVEARGEDFSLLNKRIMSSRASTEGGTSVVYKYSDELGTKYLIHEVTDARGYIIHRDFDAVRISSGQLINKGH